MSNYLTNLVRRSVGLTAMVAPRAPPPPIASEVSTQAPAAPAARDGRAADAPAREATRPAAAPARIQILAAERSVPAMTTVAAHAPEVIRAEVRSPSIEPAMPAPLRVETLVAIPASPAQEGIAAESVLVEPSPLLLPPPLLPAAAAPVSPAPAGESARPAPALVPLPAAAVVGQPPAGERNILETVRELTHRFERVIEPPAAIASVVPAAEARVTPPHAPALRTPEPLAVENRVVNVRIGAIEIHAAAAPAAAPQPAMPPAIAQRDATTGFDRFSRLRNYAAWEW